MDVAYAEPATGQGRAPFANHDARNRIESSSTMQALRARVEQITLNVGEGLHSLASQLEDHADRLHGVMPAEVERAGSIKQGTTAYPDGQLGDLYRAVDHLEHSLNMASQRLAMAAGRNTTLA